MDATTCLTLAMAIWNLIVAVSNPDTNLFSPVGITRILIATAISAVVTSGIAYFFWTLQSRSTQKRVKEHKEVEDQLARDLRIANEEKERLAEQQRELSKRVTDSEQLLGRVKEQLALLDQAAQPLFEAAKIRLIASLTHPDPEFEVPDDLLKLTLGPEGYITPELATLLKERETSTHPDVTPEEKLAAAILPSVVELAAIESKCLGPLTSQLVSTPSPQHEEKEKK